jgi:hypothetical protein
MQRCNRIIKRQVSTSSYLVVPIINTFVDEFRISHISLRRGKVSTPNVVKRAQMQ